MFSELTGGSSGGKTLSAGLIAKSTPPYRTSDGVVPMTVVSSTYVSQSSGVVTFKKACRILIHFEVVNSVYGGSCTLQMKKNNVNIGSQLSKSGMSGYSMGFLVIDVEAGDNIRGYCTRSGASGETYAQTPQIGIYVLTIT